MLALDPPDGGATIGGVVATADSGPLRHRYGAARDLLLGMTVALADGSVARSGGTVIKNVAGYDLAKLFAGSLGTLGVITEVVVRLHPLPVESATVVARGDDPAALGRVAARWFAEPLELEALDVSWSAGSGALLARVGGVAAASPRGADRRARGRARRPRFTATRTSSGPRSAQAQRGDGRAARPGASVRAAGRARRGRATSAPRWSAARASTGSSPRSAFEFPFPGVLAGRARRAARRPVGRRRRALIALSRRVKERFDPAGVCAPGIFVGGI